MKPNKQKQNLEKEEIPEINFRELEYMKMLYKNRLIFKLGTIMKHDMI